MGFENRKHYLNWFFHIQCRIKVSLQKAENPPIRQNGSQWSQSTCPNSKQHVPVFAWITLYLLQLFWVITWNWKFINLLSMVDGNVFLYICFQLKFVFWNMFHNLSSLMSIAGSVDSMLHVTHLQYYHYHNMNTS